MQSIAAFYSYMYIYIVFYSYIHSILLNLHSRARPCRASQHFTQPTGYNCGRSIPTSSTLTASSWRFFTFYFFFLFFSFPSLSLYNCGRSILTSSTLTASLWRFFTFYSTFSSFSFFSFFLFFLFSLSLVFPPPHAQY